MIRKALILSMVLLTSCASNSGVLEIGQGKMFIAKQAATGFPGTGKIKVNALKEASDHCLVKRKL